jgi:hypothetical protein
MVRFMLYGNQKKNDQIASSTGQNGFAGSKKLSTDILSSIFTEAFHAAPVVCHSGSATVFKNRLSRYNSNAKGLLRFTQGLGFGEYTTLFDPLLCRATLVKKRAFEKLLAAIFEQGWAIGMLNETSEGAIDSTGMETHHISYHFVNCTRRSSYFRRIWPKITVVCDTQTHMIASCIVTRGPGYDFYLFEEAIGEACKQMRFKRILADGGYDSEANHRIAREVFGIEPVIKLNLRGFESQPRGKYRRQMKENFDKKVYNNRWQIESVFSRDKRLLGSALRNCTEISRERECLLRILTHNLMIIRRAA